MNVFQKCLRRHMGNGRYFEYVELCRESMVKNNLPKLASESKPIFNEMYEQLKGENQAGIAERMRDLVDTLTVAFRITRYFVFVILAYILANIVLLGLDLNYYVTCVSILLLGIAFIYKLIEFLSNKFCVLDAYLFMIYKSVLEKKAKEI
ncbi:MAG: hypothetical protein LUH14_01690 [Clostridiaceae bacterium]|nr:hypothetical protein [Clostridiaceae bacterium]